ncbi:hypothetical protein ACFCXH_18820 [Streptomyces nojiriensis]|uniref:hypothetical protein n=1 Tax=Streptomyces nojiriensis TaxID=66374 RepID=UPI0035D959F6
MQRTAVVPYARLPRAHHDRHLLTSTVDVFGAAHWLFSERAPEPGGDVRPFDSLVVSAHPYGNVDLTELRCVRARWPHLDRLPDGAFVVAAARARRYENADQVQVFDELGRVTSSFCVGDAIEHLLVDGTGHLWVGHFDENPVGIRRWSATGRPAWASDDVHIPRLMDCYAVNVSGGYSEERDRLARGELPETSVEPTEVRLLTRPTALPAAAGGASAGEAGSTSRPSRSPRGARSTSAGDTNRPGGCHPVPQRKELCAQSAQRFAHHRRRSRRALPRA